MFVLASDEGGFGINQARAALKNNQSAIDAVEIGCQMVEQDFGARTVGYGGAPNILGEMECDAAVMNGRTLEVGAVGAISGAKSPISVARKVMETLPHVLLVGEGAGRFAREQGLPESTLLAPGSEESYHNWIRENVSPSDAKDLSSAALARYISFKTRSDLSRGTVTFIARDGKGDLAGGVSTSGWAYKYPGRLGDSPIIGAGLYVDNRYGAASCTHTGEMTIRTSTARSVILYMKHGATVEEACAEAMQDLAYLKTGYLGPVIIHAIDKDDRYCCMTTGNDSGDDAWWWHQDIAEPIQVTPQVFSAST